MTPANKDEYLKRFAESQRISGFGAEVVTHFPCPFCAAPDWLAEPITDGINEYAVMRRGATCKECGRSAKFIIKRDGENLSAECVQTGGDDQPEWLEPRMRRIDRPPPTDIDNSYLDSED